MNDPVNPDHYKTGGIETIDYIRAKMSLDEFCAYCRGNALKYSSRAGLKGDAAEDFRKAAWYLDRAAKELEKVKLPERTKYTDMTGATTARAEALMGHGIDAIGRWEWKNGGKEYKTSFISDKGGA